MKEKDFLTNFFHLLEYDISKGTNLKPVMDNDELEIVNSIMEDDPMPDETPETGGEEQALPDETSAPESPITEPQAGTIPGQQPGEDKNDQKLDIITQLTKIQKDNIDDIFSFIEVLKADIDQLKAKSGDIDLLKTDNIILTKQIKQLTPPTPLESLDKMVKISGGLSVDDYWADWLAKQGKEKTANLPYYQNGVIDQKSTQPITKNYSDSDVKKSIFGF